MAHDDTPPTPPEAPPAPPAPAPVVVAPLRPLVYLSYPYLTYDHRPDYMSSLQRACGERLYFFDPGERGDAWARLLVYIKQYNLQPAAVPDALFHGLDLPLSLLAPPTPEHLAWDTQLTHRSQVLRALYALLRAKLVLTDAMLLGRAENCVELLLAKLCDLPIVAVSDLPNLTPMLGYLTNAVVAPTEKLLPDLLNFYVGYTLATP